MDIIRVSVAHVNALQAENADLRRQVEELRQALEPFAWTQEDLDAIADFDNEDEIEWIVSAGELRQARAALARQEATE